MVDWLVICLIDKIQWNSIELQAKVHERSIKSLKSMDTLWNSVEIYGHSVEAVFETQKTLDGIPWGTSKGLFTRREGHPRARVTLTSGLKLALVYKQISQVGLTYHPGQLYQLC